MQEILSPEKAWQDFYEWIRQQPKWADIKGKERLRIYEANAAAKGQRGHRLGPVRMKSIFDKYAPGRYEYIEGFILKEDGQG